MSNYFSRAEESGRHQLPPIGQYGSGYTSILLHRSNPSEQKYESGKSYNNSNLRLSIINSNLWRRFTKIRFVKLGIIPHGFLMKDGTYEYIIHHYHVL